MVFPFPPVFARLARVPIQWSATRISEASTVRIQVGGIWRPLRTQTTGVSGQLDQTERINGI
jgi:hypothetical protein